ncbi:hypothetical protein CCHL11_04690 [Colletotrichum chlorophyti]|uniref:F-box protein n=1 Tax=Colletotrichum chlorophyti TaxID=708187 RepID=A0A1Q8S1L0_9PEZI|nr:hypothetical protein CCHL11_04690 [Colletotrichum chlorophyti]
MASRRLSAAGARRNPARSTTSSTSSPSEQVRVTKLRARPTSAKSGRGQAPKTRSTTRSQTRSRADAPDSEEEEEEEEEFTSSSSDLLNRSTAHTAPSMGIPGSHEPRSTGTQAGGQKAKSSAAKKRKSVPPRAATGRKRGRVYKSNAWLQRPNDDQDSSDVSGPYSNGDVPSGTSTPKTFPAKASCGGTAATKVANETNDSNPIIPNWMDPQIEHSIWVQIFRYAAVSSDDQDSRDSHWLLSTARVCRRFTDPALTVLYKCLPLRDEGRAQRLAELLEKPPSLTAINYRVKIEAMHIDVRLVSLQHLTSPIKLMQNLPRLAEVLLVHGYDQAPYRHLRESIKWTYPPELFQAFEVSPTANAEEGDKTTITRLQSWQWSSRLMERNWEASLMNIKQVHQTPSFASLRKLKFVNYQLPSVRLEKNLAADPELLSEDKRTIEMIASSISVLESIEDLTFESSTIVGSALLPLLPKKLKRFSLVNCTEVTADDLGSFLLMHGHHLESLVLHHNRSLSLAFLTILGSACPHLKELRMNFKYFSPLETIDDNEPYYDDLLLSDQIPTWPTALEFVQLENLRRWSTEAAEAFLHSFIDSSHELPMLRHLSIKAMLNISWRSRSDFRTSWQNKLRKIFLRQDSEPRPHFTMRKPPPSDSSPAAVAKRKSKKPSVEPSRRSSRIVPHASAPSSRSSSTLRGLRGHKRKPQSYLEPDSDEFDSDDDVDTDDATETDQDSPGQSTAATAGAMASEGHFIQGLCTVVDFNFDNQKPREHQYSMDDFLNDENDFESDDDWDGDMDYE